MSDGLRKCLELAHREFMAGRFSPPIFSGGDSPFARAVRGYRFVEPERCAVSGAVLGGGLHVERTENAELRKRVALPEAPGGHDYNGPTETVPHPDIPGQSIQRSVPDPAHERFHGAIGDILAGKIIPAARRQMEDALKNVPKDGAPFPVIGGRDDRRRVGWRLASCAALFCLALCGCATPEIAVKDPNTGTVVATCGGGRAGFLLGGLTGMAIEQMADQRCADRYVGVGYVKEER